MTQVRIEQFALDHWSLLLYCESRAVDYSGKLDRKHLREGDDHRPRPIRLKDGSKLLNYGDDMILNDLQDAGLIVRERHQVEMTDEGWRLAHLLRRHLSTGASPSTFEMPVEPIDINQGLTAVTPKEWNADTVKNAVQDIQQKCIVILKQRGYSDDQIADYFRNNPIRVVVSS